jgi:hypothetical protein
MSMNLVTSLGNTTVNWNPDDSVASLTYRGDSLTDVRQAAFASVSFGPPVKFTSPQVQIINGLFNAIGALPNFERKKKIYLATYIFERLNFQAAVPNPWLTSWVWRAILDITWRWEGAHENIHKGTPYYFMGENYLQMGDVASAYICFYNAVEEDKISYPMLGKNFKTAPAYLTVSLIDDPNNRLHQTVVMQLRSYLESFLQEYRTDLGGKLTLTMFDNAFLKEEKLESIKRSFVANTHETFHLAP